MIFNAKELRDKKEAELTKRVKGLMETPCLAIIQVGHNPQSDKYVGNKIKALDRVGMNYQHILLSENIGEKYLMNLINDLNDNEQIHGIMVQLPLPKHLAFMTNRILEEIKPVKDVDGLGSNSMGKLALRTLPSLGPIHLPCTALGVVEILKAMGHLKLNPVGDEYLDVTSKNVVVLGKGITSGLPISLIMMNEGANVVNLASKCSEEDRNKYLNNADIVISCVGQPNIINPVYIHADSTLVNVGMSVNEQGKLVGDYDPEEVNALEINCTSIINSTGIMTVHMLLENTYNAYLWQY